MLFTVEEVDALREIVKQSLIEKGSGSVDIYDVKSFEGVAPWQYDEEFHEILEKILQEFGGKISRILERDPATYVFKRMK